MSLARSEVDRQTVLMPPKTLPPGHTARVVAENVRRYREALNLGHTELSRRIGDLGHEVLPIGLRRVESGERRVTVDDLTALAMALEVSPTSLLTPPPATDDTEEWQNGTAELTGTPAAPPRRIWHWVRGDSPVDGEETAGAIHEFTARSAVCQAQLTELHGEVVAMDRQGQTHRLPRVQRGL